METPTDVFRPELPLCMSMVVCDRVHRDPVSQKAYILGACHHINLPRVPFQIPHLAVLCSITNAMGTYRLELRVEHEGSGAIVWRIATDPVTARSPIHHLDTVFEINRPQIKAFGSYWFKLYANDAFVANRRFFINPPGGSRPRPPAAGGPAAQ